MKDETALRLTALLCGTATILVSAITGADGLLKTAGGLLIGFGVGIGVKVLKDKLEG